MENKKFNFESDEYQNHVPFHKYFMYEKMKTAQKYVSHLDTKDLAIDLGCGNGEFTGHISSYFKTVAGIEYSDQILNTNETNSAENILFLKYNGKKLPVKKNSADCIFIVNVLHHIPVLLRKTILRECFDVLKPSGKLIIFEHNPLNPLIWFRFYYISKIDRGEIMQGPFALRKLLQNNFKNISLDFMYKSFGCEYCIVAEK